MAIRILDRYIARELLVTCAISVATLSAAILLHRIMLLVDLIVSRGVRLGVVAGLFAFSLPLSLVITVPLSALLASLTVYARMAADNEVVALKAAGMHPLRLQAPVLVFGLLASLLTGYLSLQALPSSYRAFRELVFRMTRDRVLAGLQERTFSDDLEGLTLYVQRLGADGSLRHVFLEDRRQAGERRLIVAGEGRIAFDPDELRAHLALRDGTVHIIQAAQPDRYRLLTFETFDLRARPGGALGEAADRPRDRKEVSLGDLAAEAEALRRQGRSDARPRVEAHRRFAVPVSAFLFAVVGSGLGLRMARGGRWAGVLAGAAVGLGYYGLLAGAEDAANHGLLPPAWAMWLPNLLLAIMGAGLSILAPRAPRPRRAPLMPRARPQPAA